MVNSIWTFSKDTTDMAVTKTKYDDEKRFSKENISLSKDFPVKYATFNAYQMRDLIIRKLIEDPTTRDQVYPGSNIAILVDLVATMYQTLSYQLNHAASESMFSQSQYYENIVRIAKLLGYNAKGIMPSTAMFRIEDAGDLVSQDLTKDIGIPPFSMVRTSNGKYYSYSPSKWQGCQVPKNLDPGQPYDIVLHNGMWKHYQTVFTPNGSDFETFVMPMVRSEMDEQKYATTTHIFAVEVVGGADEGDWGSATVNLFHPTNAGLFKGLPNANDTDQIHGFLYNGLGGDDCNVFNVELNELKQLVIKFGDGITTSKLTPNSKLHIFYLETQGMDGGIQPSDEELTFHHGPAMFGIPDGLYARLFGSSAPEVENLKCKVLTGSTSAVKEESVEEIRERAPHWFKMNNRLVTKEDYEFFVMNEPSISGMFNSVKVMNNWEYVATFYRWLNQLGIKGKTHESNPRFYLNPARFTKYGGASLSDAVDSNNVYIWYITNFGDVSDINYDQMVQRCKSMMVDIKDLCHEPVFLPAIPIRCEISSVPEELALQYLQSNRSTTVPYFKDSDGNEADASWLEVRIDDDYSISSYEVIERVCSLFTYFFNVGNRQVGFGPFNTNDIVNLIMEKVPAVSDIYTVYQEGRDATPVYTHGISMACFATNTSLVNLGDDLQVNSGNISLEPFMYPVLYTNTEAELKNRIKVVNKNINILSRNNY